MTHRTSRHAGLILATAALAVAVSCGGNKPPTASPTAPPASPQPFPGAATGGGSTTPNRPPAPPDPNTSVVPTPPEPIVTPADPLVSASPDQINQQSPLQPVYFAFDSDQIDDMGRRTLNEDADVLKKYSSWVVSIEGHSDERGTAEYNLALGERRALAAKSFLLSLGIPADRLRTVSYGKEFPFDPGHDERAWSKNRRAHFMVTSK